MGNDESFAQCYILGELQSVAYDKQTTNAYGLTRANIGEMNIIYYFSDPKLLSSIEFKIPSVVRCIILMHHWGKKGLPIICDMP